MTRLLLVTLYGYQNTGIRLLSAMLEREGFSAPILYMKRWANNDVHPPTQKEFRLFERFVEESAPDVVGFGFGTPYLSIVTDLTHSVKKVSDAHVIWGGVHPTICPEDGEGIADSICIGEGEYPLLDLATAMRDGKPIDNIRNLWVRTDSEMVKNPLRPLIENLDELPYTLKFNAEITRIEDNWVRRGDPMQDNALYRVFASRGCPFRCSFCYNNQFREIYNGLGKYHRLRSVESVLDELEVAKKQMPTLRRVRFDDDSFVFPRAWLDRFVEEYPKRIGLPFDILFNPQTNKPGVLDKLKTAGLVHVQVGIQSASEKELREDYSRAGSREQVLELASQLKELGIDVTYDVILDNPLATEEDQKAMMELLLTLPRPFSMFLYSLTVFPKSDVAKNLLKAGLITENEIEGKATKSFRQFRLSLDYPRPSRDTFWACLISLSSKSFVPKSLVRRLSRSGFLMRHPAPLRFFAEITNAIKLAALAWKMFRQGELSVFKLREYASFKRRLIQ